MDVKNIETLNALVNNLYDVQKVRIGMANRNQALQQKDREEIFDDHVVRLKKLERDIVRQMQHQITMFPISSWMLGQRGIGPSLAGQTIAIVRDIGRFSNISKLWSYSGMATIEICTVCGKRHIEGDKKVEWTRRVAKRLEEQHNKKKKRVEEQNEISGGTEPVEEEDTNFSMKAKKMLCSCSNPVIKVTAQRRIKNTIIDYNPKMKKLCRNIALSLIQYNENYGNMYEEFLEKYMARDNLLKELKQDKFSPAALEKIKKGRAVKMARRKMVKIFLSHLWVQWRKMEGLPVTMPYAIDIKKHADYIPPEEKYVELTELPEPSEEEETENVMDL